MVIKDAAGTTVYSKDLKDVGAQDTSAAGTSGNWTVDVTLAAAMGNFIFEVRKAPRSLTVTATTTGTNLDSDGYTATLDGAGSQTVGGNGSATFTNLSPASHTVVLSGVAANCSVSGGASRTFTVPAGGTTTAAFSVTCT